MSLLYPFLLVLHVLPATLWLGVTAVASNLGARGASLPLRKPQLASSIAAILFGAALWWTLAPEGLGPREQSLGIGALAAVIAAILQQAVAWPAAARSRATFAVAQRVSGVLLVLALIQMVIFRFVS